jgi:hypothetical protein
MCLNPTILVLACASSLFGQSLGSTALSEIPSLDSAPELAAWHSQHPGERLKTAAFDNEYESQGLWCAASVADMTLKEGVHATRFALFYVPTARLGDALPARPNRELVKKCRLLTLWYEVRDSGALVKSTAAELAALGTADQSPRFKREDDWGSGYWDPYLVWETPKRRVILAADPRGARTLIIARAAQAPRGLSLDWLGEAPKNEPSLKACAFDDGHNNWQDGLIAASKERLRAAPTGTDTSYLHLAMARAYAAKLLLTYPGIDLNGANMPFDPESLRDDAIAQYRAFLDENPNAPEAGNAGNEAWRLLAGLPPSPIHFACTD